MESSLVGFSEELSSLVEKGGKSVLRVDGRHRFPASGIAWGNQVVVTASHVLERDESIHVGWSEGDQYSARLLGRDTSTDLAALGLDQALPEPLIRASSVDIKTGHLVLALGRPGTRVRASLGLVNSSGPSWRTGAGGSIDRYIQTSVNMLPGFSGGPLLAMDGRLIGINTSAMSQEGSLVIPVETIDRVVSSLVAHGKVRRAYLGITSQPVRLGESDAKKHNQASGLIIIHVEPGSPASSGGVLQGDILLSVGGIPTLRMEDLMAALTRDDPSASIPVRLLRGGEVKELSVQPKEKE